MYISPEDKAMVITFSGASLLVLIFFFITIKPFDEKQEEEFFDIPIVELPEPEPEELQEIAQLPDNQKITHQAFNSKRLQREANRFFSQEDEVREALENEAASESEESDEISDEVYTDYKARLALLKAQAKKEQSSGEDKTEKVAKVNTTTSRRSTVSYILNDRNALKIPNPVYTCDATGKVVINIVVNDQGAVTKTSYNKGSSTTANGCLVDQAMLYAERAFFNRGNRDSQLGSITFEFQG
tara:strand:- start:210 stop:935 length:726 start_codon:yes stop_codon:yes gene_type:complete